MELSTEEIRKAVNDAFDENMTEVDRWNDAVFYSSKEKLITDVVKKLTIPVVAVSAYFAAKGMQEVIVLADNIADAMDKLEESKKDYKLITAKSYEVIK